MNSLPTVGERLNASSAVLDSSALLATILREPGDDFVRRAIDRGAVISSVNLAEVISRLVELSLDRSYIEVTLQEFRVPVVALGESAGRVAGYLRSTTRYLGLSLGDRACLALAAEMGVPAITADRIWKELDVGVEVVLCR
jgi:ribonuclease VapC